jgi:hypothetical protein
MRETPVHTHRDPDGQPAVADSGPGCVYVVGMHRSGTSATTEVLGRLGLASPAPDELVPATSANERGHFEAKTLVRLNDRLLRALGGTWSAPPTLTPGWEHDDSLDELRSEAADSFTTVFPERPAAWKDPRNCIVLPFWRAVVGPAAAVFVYRDPYEVARSLQARNDLSLTLGLALWERYIRAACANLDGVPTFCTDFQGVLDDPETWGRQAVDFLGQAGVALAPASVDRATASVDGALRHHDGGVEDDRGLGDSRRRILDVLHALDGPHHPWVAPDLEPEPPWISDVLSMRLEFDTLGRAHRAMLSSRAFRVATAVGRLRGRPS